MELMQFSAVVLLTLLLLKLLLLPRKVTVNSVVDKARWLMAAGILLLDIHFLLQFTLGLRQMGVTQAVLVNLLMFIPSSWTISLSIQCLQGQGRLIRADRWIGGATWAGGATVLISAAAADGQPLLTDTPELQHAEAIVSGAYLLMQCYYSWRLITNMREMRQALQNYYDSEKYGILMWMQVSVLLLTVLAALVPMLIFLHDNSPAVFAIVFFTGIFFLVDGFCNYVVSSSPRKMMEAEAVLEKEPAVEEGGELVSLKAASSSTETFDEDSMQMADNAVKHWIEDGGYRRCGITMPAAADEMHLPRYLLSAWLKKTGKTYAVWMTDLRIEEAKQVIKNHPEWSNESVAHHCGFSDRTYFQKKFKEKTGLSPADYLAGLPDS